MKCRLVCFDMDGIVFKNENFWAELHKFFGGKKRFKHNKKEDYVKTALEVSEFCKGRDYGKYLEFVNEIKYNPAVKEVFSKIKGKGIKAALISSGPIELAERAQEDLSIDFIYTNRLVIDKKSNKITGEFWAPVKFGNKGEILSTICAQEGVDKKEVVSVGHDADDINLATASGVSIAFNSKSDELNKKCDYRVKGSLKGVLKHIK